MMIKKSGFWGILAVGLLASAFSFTVPARAADQTFTGEIMDSACAKAGNHDAMINSGKMKDAKSCTLGCVKGGASFVLYNPAKKMVYMLDDQTKPVDFAGAKVKVMGTYDKATKTIHVTDIKAAA
jgi:hypothetical protein